LGDNLPPVLSGEGELEQVVLNLLDNAADAMPEGGVIVLMTESVDGGALLEVRDMGHGMTETVMEKAFFPFFTTKGVGKGTGLGLSICHGIVTEHGGRIYAANKPGGGAVFSVELPLTAGDGEEP